MNTLSAKKECFLKLKIDTLFASNLFKIARSFLHQKVSCKIYVYVKFFEIQISVILQVEPDGLSYGSVIPIMLLFKFYCHLLYHLHVLEVTSHYEQELLLYRLK